MSMYKYRTHNMVDGTFTFLQAVSIVDCGNKALDNVI